MTLLKSILYVTESLSIDLNFWSNVHVIFYSKRIPYLRRSNTSIILNAFMSGIREAGGEISLFNLSKMQISTCRGDINCWFRTRGKCVQQDDMEKLREPFTNADIIVFSTPVYCDGVPGQLKVMMYRLVVGGDPLLEIRDNHSRHPVAKTQTRQKFILISSCGLWEEDNFDPIVMNIKPDSDDF